jgi:ABC-type glycerol-3-phosphate transport system substrate-binding protein
MRKNTYRWVFLLAIVACLVTIPMVNAQQKLTIWGWEFVKDTVGVADDFLAENPDVEIEFQVIAAGDLYQKLLLTLSAGSGAPDIVALENSRVPQFIQTGGLMDLTRWVDPYRDQFVEYKWVDVKDQQNRIYALPIDAGPMALFYRRDIFEKAGLPSEPADVADLLQTWDDYLAVAKRIKEATGSYMFALAKGANDGRIFENLLNQRGIGYFDSKGNVILDSPKAVEVLRLFGQFWEHDLVQDTEPWTSGWYAGIADGGVATIVGAVWMGGFMKSWIAPDAEGLWGVVPLPGWAGEPRASANDGGSTLAITKYARNPELAWRFIEYQLTQKDQQVRMWRDMDSFPALMTAFSDPLVDQPDPYFGGQSYRRVFIDAVQQIPEWWYTEDYAEANNLMSTEIVNFALGRKTADKAIADAAAAIRRNTGRK